MHKLLKELASKSSLPRFRAQVCLFEIPGSVKHPQYDPTKKNIVAFFMDTKKRVFGYQQSADGNIRIFKTFDAAIGSFTSNELMSDHRGIIVMTPSNPEYGIVIEQAILILDRTLPGIFLEEAF